MDNKYNEKELLAKIGELTMRSEQLATARGNSVSVDGECATVVRERIESLAKQVRELSTENERLSLELAEAMESADRHLDSAIRSGEILQTTADTAKWLQDKNVHLEKMLAEMRDYNYGRTSKMEAWRRELERIARSFTFDPLPLIDILRADAIAISKIAMDMRGA